MNIEPHTLRNAPLDNPKQRYRATQVHKRANAVFAMFWGLNQFRVRRDPKVEKSEGREIPAWWITLARSVLKRSSFEILRPRPGLSTRLSLMVMNLCRVTQLSRNYKKDGLHGD